MLRSIYQWHRVTLNGIVIGSRSSRYTRRAVSRENFFVRIRYENHGRNTLYTYKDTYVEILHYLEVSPLPDVPPLMLAYVQHYDVLLSSNLVEQRNQSGAPVYVHAGNIRSLLARFQCLGKVRNQLVQRTWFIDRDRMYKTMKALSRYHIGRIDVTDDSVGSSDDDEADGVGESNY